MSPWGQILSDPQKIVGGFFHQGFEHSRWKTFSALLQLSLILMLTFTHLLLQAPHLQLAVTHLLSSARVSHGEPFCSSHIRLAEQLELVWNVTPLPFQVLTVLRLFNYKPKATQAALHLLGITPVYQPLPEAFWIAVLKVAWRPQWAPNPNPNLSLANSLCIA